MNAAIERLGVLCAVAWLCGACGRERLREDVEILAAASSCTPDSRSGCDGGIKEMPAARDLCPSSPRETRDLARGCSPLELALRPWIVLGPILTRLDQERSRIGTSESYREAAAALDEAGALVLASGSSLERGLVCDGARLYSQAAASLGTADAAMEAAVSSERRRLAGTNRSRTDDVLPEHIAMALLELDLALFRRAVAPALEEQGLIDSICDAVVGPIELRAKIVETNDATRLVRLEDGQLVGLGSADLDAVVKGRVASVAGSRFADGSVIATTATSAVARGPGLPGSCLSLRIAPIQDFFAGPPVLHHLDGYKWFQDVLALEHGMRLGVARIGCASATPDGRALTYSMKIELSLGGVTHSLATDLEAGEAPVSLPPYLDDAVATLSTTVYRKSCKIFPGSFESCQPPQEIDQRDYLVNVRALGYYADAVYDDTAVGIVDDGVAGNFEGRQVTGIELHLVSDSTNPLFVAEGYGVVSGISTRPQVVPVGLGELFAVYEDDFFDPELLFFEDQVISTGQSTPSGLRWPHIEGTRNGRKFWYYASLPALPHDRIAICPLEPASTLPAGPQKDCAAGACSTDCDAGGCAPECDAGSSCMEFYQPPADYPLQAVKDTFYKLPFEEYFSPGSGLMNVDDEDLGARHGPGQAYALDLGADYDKPLLAARGGEVTFVKESDPWNWNDPNMPEDWPSDLNNGNSLFIHHEDGTFAVYFHMPQDGIDVFVGQKVKRGQKIARVGATGNASGPHVHFGVHSQQVSQWNSLRVRYDALVGARQQHDPCYIPRSQDTFYSTNAAP